MTTKTDEQERAEFEEWYRQKYDSTLYCESRWEAWKAARAALQSQDKSEWMNRLISLAVSYGDSRHFETEADDRRDAACRSAQAFKNLIDHARRIEGEAK